MPALRRALLPALTCAVLSVPATAAAETVTIGATLDLVTPNSDPAKTCAAGTWWVAELGLNLPNLVPVGDRGSCQFTASGFYNGAVFGLSYGGVGTAKAARVKIGAITGRMRINVVRTLFQQTGNVASPSVTTPFLKQYGPIFTPTANAVTTVPLNLPLGSEATPDPSDIGTVAGTDWLALEVLDGNVPVPLVPYPAASFFAAFPGPTAVNSPAPGNFALPNYGQNGYVVAMSADIETRSTTTGGKGTGGPTTGGPATGGAGTGGAGTGAAVSLGTPAVKVRAGRAPLALTFASAGTGQVTLQAKTSSRSYGRASFTATAGQQQTIRVPLNSRGRALLRKSARANVRAIISFNGNATPTTLPVTLRR